MWVGIIVRLIGLVFGLVFSKADLQTVIDFIKMIIAALGGQPAAMTTIKTMVEKSKTMTADQVKVVVVDFSQKFEVL